MTASFAKKKSVVGLSKSPPEFYKFPPKAPPPFPFPALPACFSFSLSFLFLLLLFLQRLRLWRVIARGKRWKWKWEKERRGRWQEEGGGGGEGGEGGVIAHRASPQTKRKTAKNKEESEGEGGGWLAIAARLATNAPSVPRNGCWSSDGKCEMFFFSVSPRRLLPPPFPEVVLANFVCSVRRLCRYALLLYTRTECRREGEETGNGNARNHIKRVARLAKTRRTDGHAWDFFISIMIVLSFLRYVVGKSNKQSIHGFLHLHENSLSSPVRMRA